MLIKGYELQSNIVIEVGKFAILWNVFERSWCNYKCNPSKIKNIAQEIRIDATALAQLGKVLKERCHLFNQLTAEYVSESLHSENAYRSSDEDMGLMQHFIEQVGNQQTCGCLLILYRIRNNLMHGMKLLEELNGQFELFHAANTVLESINDPYELR